MVTISKVTLTYRTLWAITKFLILCDRVLLTGIVHMLTGIVHMCFFIRGWLQHVSTSRGLARDFCGSVFYFHPVLCLSAAG